MASEPDTKFSMVLLFRKYGFVSYMRELFTCPEPVMRYLCKMYNIHKVPVGTRYTKDNLHVVIRDCPEVRLFYTDVDRVTNRSLVFGTWPVFFLHPEDIQ